MLFSFETVPGKQTVRGLLTLKNSTYKSAKLNDGCVTWGSQGKLQGSGSHRHRATGVLWRLHSLGLLETGLEQPFRMLLNILLHLPGFPVGGCVCVCAHVHVSVYIYMYVVCACLQVCRCVYMCIHGLCMCMCVLVYGLCMVCVCVYM